MNYTAEQKAVNGGLLDKFVQATSRTGTGCATDGSTVMAYYDGNTVTALWNYAQHYAMDDNSFGTTFGPSTVGAINLISGQTGNGHLALTFAKGQVELAAAAGHFDEAISEYVDFRKQIAAVPVPLQNAEPWSLFNPAVHDAHYTALRQMYEVANGSSR